MRRRSRAKRTAEKTTKYQREAKERGMELVPLVWEVGGVPSDETKKFLCLTTLTVDEDRPRLQDYPGGRSGFLAEWQWGRRLCGPQTTHHHSISVHIDTAVPRPDPTSPSRRPVARRTAGAPKRVPGSQEDPTVSLLYRERQPAVLLRATGAAVRCTCTMRARLQAAEAVA
jgi:hypothetical protein